LPYNNLYRSLGSQDSDTNISQVINETKAAQAKTAMIIEWLNYWASRILSVSLGQLTGVIIMLTGVIIMPYVQLFLPEGGN